jgi:hypothetical protein
MNLDFDYFSGKDLHYPVKPRKPSLMPNATASQVREYADQLEAHDAAMVQHKEDQVFYTNEISRRQAELQSKICNKYDITPGQFVILWNRAREDGCSEGLHRVVEIFDDLYDIASEFAALEKN